MKLSIRNFKAIKSLDIDLSGRNIIKGDHDTGKTSIADAIMWLVNDTNIYQTPNFNPKPIINNEIQDVLTEVSIQVGNFEFKKTTQYKRNKDNEITGNDNKYLINNVPSTKKEFDAQLESIFGVGGIPLIVALNPRYFTDVLDVAKKRKFLLDMVGSKTREEMIDDMPEISLSDKDYLKSFGTMDLYKQSSSLTTAINKARSEIKTNNEMKIRYQSDISNKDFGDIKTKAGAIKEQIAQLEASKAKEGQSDDTERQIAFAQRNEIASKGYELKSQISDIQSKIIITAGFENEAELMVKRKEELQNELESLRRKSREIAEEKFNAENCITCNQSLPAEQIEVLRKGFETKQLDRYNSLKDKGESIKVEIKSSEERRGKAENNIKEANKANQKNNVEIDKLRAELQKIVDGFNAIGVPEPKIIDTKEIDDKISQLNAELAGINEGLKEETISDYAKVQIKKSDLQIQSSQIEALDLAKKKELIDRYNKYEILTIENGVNKLFDTVRFTMFEDTFSGEPKPICDPRIDNVPYNQLNGRGKVMVVKEIAEAVHKKYDLKTISMLDRREEGMDVFIDLPNTLLIQATDNCKPNLQIMLHTENKNVEHLKY